MVSTRTTSRLRGSDWLEDGREMHLKPKEQEVSVVLFGLFLLNYSKLCVLFSKFCNLS